MATAPEQIVVVSPTIQKSTTSSWLGGFLDFAAEKGP
jgi:hypothetical protein